MECELLSTSYRDATDWTAADGALLDELVHLLGPAPAQDEQDVPGLPDLDSEIEEVFTTADLLSSTREADPLMRRTRRTPTCSSTRHKMSARCSGACCGGRAAAPAGPSWATLPRAPGPTLKRRTGRSRISEPHRAALSMSTNYRSPSEVYDPGGKDRDRRLPGCRPPRCGTRSRASAGLLVPADAVPDRPTVAAAMINIVRTLLAEVEGTVGVICAVNQRRPGDPARRARLRGADRVAVVTPQESRALSTTGS